MTSPPHFPLVGAATVSERLQRNWSVPDSLSEIGDNLAVLPVSQKGEDGDVRGVRERTHAAVAQDELAHAGVAAAERSIADPLHVPDRIGAPNVQYPIGL